MTTATVTSALNGHYAAAVKSVVSINKVSVPLWTNLVMFAASAGATDATVVELFKGQEKTASLECKVKMGENSTYRSAKSVITSAITLGIAITVSGIARPKSEVEKDIKDGATPKTATERYEAAVTLAGKQVDKMSAAELVSAGVKANELVAMIKARLIATPVAKVA